MNTCSNTSFALDRRSFLQRTAAGFGWLAFAALNARLAQAGPLAPKKPHFTARAKRVIFLFMQGGPSHLDTFDWKPELASRKGGAHQLLGSVIDFHAHGQSGQMISDVFPKLAEHADELCILNGIQTKTNSHMQATIALHTGSETFVRPSMGAWITYGLGTLAEDLPGFVTIDPMHDQGGAMNYGSAFLPAAFQGSRLSGGGAGVPNIANRSLLSGDQRRQLDFIQRLNGGLLAKQPHQPEIEGVIESFELAHRMQTSVPGVLDTSDEPESVRRLYGIGDRGADHFGSQCLLARRLAEKGVRFIQLTSNGWDHHSGLRKGLTERAESIDQPIAGLLTDLKQRGMLDDTLVVWGGEFGRGPHDDKGNGDGRGHHGRGYTMWMAGGGTKGGLRYGATDEIGDEAVEGKMDIQDLHATILHLLGLDHEALTYNYAGRDFRLTNVSGKVAKAILA
ncbi:MAG: DUF1501 domain-containing protein [Chthoniobacteraceae bacterium]